MAVVIQSFRYDDEAWVSLLDLAAVGGIEADPRQITFGIKAGDKVEVERRMDCLPPNP